MDQESAEQSGGGSVIRNDSVESKLFASAGDDLAPSHQARFPLTLPSPLGRGKIFVASLVDQHSLTQSSVWVGRSENRILIHYCGANLNGTVLVNELLPAASDAKALTLLLVPDKRNGARLVVVQLVPSERIAGIQSPPFTRYWTAVTPTLSLARPVATGSALVTTCFLVGLRITRTGRVMSL